MLFLRCVVWFMINLQSRWICIRNIQLCESYVMNLSINKDVKQQVFSFPCNAWFDEECKAHLKLAKDKHDKALTLYQHQGIVMNKKRQNY